MYVLGIPEFLRNFSNSIEQCLSKHGHAGHASESAGTFINVPTQLAYTITLCRYGPGIGMLNRSWR